MAKLVSEQLSLEVSFVHFDGDSVIYEFKFLWDDKPLVNDDVLKNHGWWQSRSHGAFRANEWEHDTLIGFIEKALQTDGQVCWEPYEPDVYVAIYPQMHFPFTPPTPKGLATVGGQQIPLMDSHLKTQPLLFQTTCGICSYNSCREKGNLAQNQLQC